MGYKVVSCGDYMTGEQRHDQKEFVWTMYKNKEEWENSTKWQTINKQGWIWGVGEKIQYSSLTGLSMDTWVVLGTMIRYYYVM
jgi:hypothetical protein